MQFVDRQSCHQELSSPGVKLRINEYRYDHVLTNCATVT